MHVERTVVVYFARRDRSATRKSVRKMVAGETRDVVVLGRVFGECLLLISVQ